MRQADTDAAALLAIAERLIRLPAYDRCHPEAFYEGKSEIHAEIIAIAQRMTGRLPAPAPRRPRRASTETIVIGNRRIMVQRRAAFAL